MFISSILKLSEAVEFPYFIATALADTLSLIELFNPSSVKVFVAAGV